MTNQLPLIIHHKGIVETGLTSYTLLGRGLTAIKSKQLANEDQNMHRVTECFDPFLLEIMSVAVYYLEGEVKSFSAYSKLMLNKFGEKVKPYLLSCYQGIRYYPGFDSTGMTPYKQTIAEHKALMAEPVHYNKHTKPHSLNSCKFDQNEIQDKGQDNP